MPEKIIFMVMTLSMTSRGGLQNRPSVFLYELDKNIFINN